MKILVVGSRGLLGQKVVEYFTSKKVEVITADLPEYNILSYLNMKKIFDRSFDFCINCAAYTNVPKAEEEKQKAYFVNSQGVGVLSKLCIENKVHLIHFSTDFVFDGLKKGPYFEEDKKNPLNVYGSTKLSGEEIIKKKMSHCKKDLYTIFRLQWLYGLNEKTFFMKVFKKAQLEKELKIVDDEFGSPTSVAFIAETLYLCLSYKTFKKFKGQIFHLTHDDYCSRFDCAQYFIQALDLNTKVTPINNIETSVNRPKFGVLDNSKLREVLKMNLGSWKSDLNLFIKELKNV